jgi:hypothetical protein
MRVLMMVDELDREEANLLVDNLAVIDGHVNVNVIDGNNMEWSLEKEVCFKQVGDLDITYAIGTFPVYVLEAMRFYCVTIFSPVIDEDGAFVRWAKVM